MKKYWQLFITFARIGLFTIGGGYAMLPMMQSELVERHGWATEQEMMDYYALAQCTPAPSPSMFPPSSAIRSPGCWAA